MTIRHMSDLHFDEHYEFARKRARRLRDAGYIVARPSVKGACDVFHIGKKGFTALAEHGCLDRYPNISWASTVRRSRVSDLTLQHELTVMNIRSAFSVAVRPSPTLVLHTFTTWPELSQFYATNPAIESRVLVKPDGFIDVVETRPDMTLRRHFFFLEVDRSTEVLRTLVDRGHCYFNYYKDGGFAERQGATPEARKHFPFRLLLVCKSSARRNNLAIKLSALTPPVKNFVWLTTEDDMTTTPLGKIWMTPKSYPNLCDQYLLPSPTGEAGCP